MTELFLKIFNMSISASWLVLAVLVFRLAIKNAPKWVNILLWGMVAVRLICPFSFESALSLIPSAETISPDIMMSQTPTIQTGIPAVNSVVNPVITDAFAPEQIASANPLQIWLPILACIWALGVFVLLAYTVISYWRLQRKVSTAVVLCDNIFQSENVSSPFVLGIMKPKIYLPFNVGDPELEHVVAHEQAHIRRRDHWWKPLGFLLLTIHWFNPLMWLAYVLLCRDIELACDEKVIKVLGDEQRADYTQALVACSVNRRMAAACPLAFGEVGVKERVKSVMNYKKPAFWIVVASVVACMVVAVCFLTDPPDDELHAPEPFCHSYRVGEIMYQDMSRKLTLEDILVLSEKGHSLSWRDFEEYSYIETGSGLYIRVYEIDEQFRLAIGGAGPDSEPMYIYLGVYGDDVDARIDIRDGGVEEFISKHGNNQSLPSAVTKEELLEVFRESNRDEGTVITTDCVMADDGAYGLDGVVQYSDETGVPWKLAFIRDGAAYPVSQDWSKEYTIASELTYLGNGIVQVYIENLNDGTFYTCTMEYSYDEAENQANFKAASEKYTPPDSNGDEPFAPYSLRISRSDLQIFDGPGYDAAYVGALGAAGTYTIVEEQIDAEGNRWGKLKSGIGWVDLAVAQSNDAVPITAVFSNEQISGNYHEYVADDSEYMTKLLFSANEDLKDVRFSSLQYENGTFKVVEELYSLAELSPDMPLVTGVVFYGDMTTYGISLTDASGAERHFSIYISGRNGALMLEEYIP